jgi:hypothetical protein
MDAQMATPSSQALSKRRKDDDVDAFDDAGGQGAKHWTDDEKSKLFRWLMGPNSDDHWAALRATKNSCLREVRAISLHLAPPSALTRVSSAPTRSLTAKSHTRPSRAAMNATLTSSSRYMRLNSITITRARCRRARTRRQIG